MSGLIRNRRGIVVGVLICIVLACGVAAAVLFSSKAEVGVGESQEERQQEAVSDKLVETSDDAAALGEAASNGGNVGEGLGGPGTDYDPLPFKYDKPLSEMPRNDEGRIVTESGSLIIPGVLYVDFGPEGESVEKMTRLLEEKGFETKDPYWHRYLDCGEIRAYCPDGMSEEESYSILMGIEGVESVDLCYVAKDGYMRLFDESIDQADGGRTVVTPEIDRGEYQLAWGGFEEAWETVKCEGRVTVAVIDTGAPDPRLSDLASNVDYSRGFDATGGDGLDAVGHGTAVASVISAVADDDGCTGCSWNAKVLPLKVVNGTEFEKRSDGFYDLDNLWDCFDYLLSLNDAPDVVNMSFGGAIGEGELRSSDVDLMQDYIDRLANKGCVCVAAVGNDGGFSVESLLGNDHDNSVNYPAACDGVIAVGALGYPISLVYPPEIGNYAQSVYVSGYSNSASDTDVVAFGMRIQTLSLSPVGIEGTSKETGTSFSAPQVAAAAALVKRAHPGYEADKIAHAITCTARKIDSMGDENRTDACGYGALDAAAAIKWTVEGDPCGAFTGGSSSGDWSPTAGGSLLERYRESLGNAS